MSSQASEDDAEKRHYNEVVASMRHYYFFFRITIVKRMVKHHGRLTPAQTALLPGGAAGVKTKCKAYDDALRANQRFYDRVLLHMGEAPSALTVDFDPSTVKKPSVSLGSWRVPTHHANKLSGTLHALSRDWSSDGAPERVEAYTPILGALRRHVDIGSQVLVPGSGLSRLCCEIAGQGFKSQGNDFDLFMLFVSDFMLNGLKTMPSGDGSSQSPEVVVVYPWAHALCNNRSHADPTNGALRPVEVPDVPAAVIMFGDGTDEDEEGGEEAVVAAWTPPPVLPLPTTLATTTVTTTAAAAAAAAAATSLTPLSLSPTPAATESAAAVPLKRCEVKAAQDLSMCAGEFMFAYNDTFGQWDAFVSCFFVDTAPNILEYVELVKNLLKPGAVWINVGPLMYHWADQYSEVAHMGKDDDDDDDDDWRSPMDERYEQSLELSWEELKHAMEASGWFAIEECDEDVPCHYNLNPHSLMRTQYRCLYFVARRLPDKS